MEDHNDLPLPPERRRDHDLSGYYERALLPFEDNELFKRRLFAENSYLRKNPGLRADIATVLERDDDQSLVDMIELLDLSRQVDAPENQTPFRALMAQVTLSREINDVKIGAIGEATPTSRTNALMNLVGRKLVDAIPHDQLYEYDMTARFIRNQVQTADGLTERKREWFASKTDHLSTLIEQRVLLEEYFEDMPEKDTTPITPGQIAQDDSDIATLFTEARKHQRYGVKIGYKEQEYRPGSLVFSPPFDLDAIRASANQAHRLMFAKGDKQPVAVITDSQHRSFKKKISAVVEDLGPGRYRANLNIGGRHIFTLLDSGELTTYHTDSNLADIAAAQGSYNAYRHLQAEMLADFIDLTSDLGLARSLGDVRVPKATETNYARESGTDIIRKLLIPRIRAEEGERGDGEDISREVRLHGVVWHRRRLPLGWHASPEALALAREANITLEEGETFVRSHTRGSKALGEVVAHQLVVRF